MQFEEIGLESGKTLMLLPGTCCDYQTNFANVLNTFLMSESVADGFMGCFAKFKPESIKNQYYTDLLTYLDDDINVEHTKAHFIYANKMGEKYLKRYKKYFHNPEIREFDMQHEQWLLGEEKYTIPVLKAIDEFMDEVV